jgi:hypothetical protein
MSSVDQSPQWQNQHALLFVAFFGLHFIIATYLKLIVGIDIEADPQRNTWDWFWQTIDARFLLTSPLQSIWYFHAQPPLFNLFGAGMITLFQSPLQAMQWVYILLGSAITGMAYFLTQRLSRNTRLSIVVGLFVGTHPALFLYEAYILYSLLTAFWIILAVFFMTLALDHHSSHTKTVLLLSTVATICALILTRSLYHIVLLVPTIMLVSVASGKQWRQVLFVSLVIGSVPVGWYWKNHTQFGFFGGSSWLGMGLWNIASARYTDQEIDTFAAAGMIDQMVAEVRPFSLPSAYQVFGINRDSDIPVLAEDDYNNVNIPDISQIYLRNASTLIALEPSHYVKTTLVAYLLYSNPSTHYKHLVNNRELISDYVDFHANWLQGHALFRRANYPGSVFAIVLPACVLLYLWHMYRRRGCGWINLIQTNGAMTLAIIILVYSSSIKYGSGSCCK